MKRAEWTKGMKSHGVQQILLAYSLEHHNRAVYEDADGRLWIDFYKQKVEVVERWYPYHRFVTVESY